MSGEPYILIKNFDDVYTIVPFFISRAAWYDIGTIEDHLAVLGSGGVFDAERLATGGAVGQVLARTGTGSAWANSPDQSRWVIEDANVGGTNDALTLTTGDNLTAIPEGADFVFRSLSTPNTGPVTVDIDGTGAAEIRSGAGGSAPGSHRPIRTGEIATREDYIINFDGFYYGIRASLLGIAGNYDVGLTDGSLVALITEDGIGDQLPVVLLSPGGGVGDVLTRTQDGKRWMAPGSGTGDITAVGVGTGLSGGGTSGDVTINLDLINLPNYPGSMNSFDRVIVLDQSDSNLPKDIIIDDFSNFVARRMRLDLLTVEGQIAPSDNLVFASGAVGGFPRRISLGGLANRLVDSSTLVANNAVMSIGDEGVSEVHLNATNAATTGQVLSAAAAGQFTWIDGTGTGDITAVTTAGDSGLTGGADSGAVDLALSFSGLPALTSLSGGDYFAITDISDSNTIKRKDIVDVGVYLVSGSTTLDHITNGLLEVASGGITAREIADGTITEPKLDMANAPATSQVITWDGSGLSWAAAGSGTITGVTAGTGLEGGGTTGTVTVDIANGGVDTAQIANFGVTVGKMAITNTPTSGQLLSYAGPNMTWIDGGGTGDITAITTASGSGLSGGVDTGAADLALDIAGLTNQSSTSLNDSDILFIGDVSDSADPRKHLSVGGLMSFATAGEATTDSGGGKIRVASGGITTQELADNTITEPKLQIAGNPGTDNLLSWDGSALRWIPAFDLISLPGLGTVETGDLMLVSDTSDGGDSKRVQVLNVMNSMVATSTTLEVSSDQLELSDGAVTEPILAITGTPTTGQFIAWDGSAAWNGPRLVEL